jgi:ATP-dependent DNA helicase RecG
VRLLNQFIAIPFLFLIMGGQMELQMLRLEERIKTRIELGESHFREFKSAFQRDVQGHSKPRDLKDMCKDVGEALVAFANADGGELLIGIEDDGQVTGIPHKQELIDAMKRAVITHVHNGTPLTSPIVRQVNYEDKEILYFCVSKSTVHVHLTSDGRCLQRFDKLNRPVPTEQIQYERREQRSREYDRSFVDGAGMKDLDLGLMDSVAQQVAQGYSPEKLLQFLDLAEYGPEGLRLRKAALLLFAKDVSRWHPRCEVRILRVHGTELKVGTEYNVVQDDLVGGNIVSILESAWEVLRPHLARTHFQSDALFREIIMYPEIACREALVNAVAHRDYSIEGCQLRF